MSRPKPVILLSHTDARTYRAEQVLKADAIYAVFLDDQPINLRSLHQIINNGPKYKKSSFPNPGHAFNLADKLNKLFATDRFSVCRLTEGECIDETDCGRDADAR